MKIVLLLLGAITVFGYQNCGDMSAKSAGDWASSTSNVDFFEYPYKSQPAFYGEINLYKASSSVRGLAAFKFIGAAVAADPTKSVSYVITVTDANAVAMCPTESGSLAAGATEIQFDCTSSVSSTMAYVTMTLTAGAASSSITKSFAAN